MQTTSILNIYFADFVGQMLASRCVTATDADVVEAVIKNTLVARSELSKDKVSVTFNLFPNVMHNVEYFGN